VLNGGTQPPVMQKILDKVWKKETNNQANVVGAISAT